MNVYVWLGGAVVIVNGQRWHVHYQLTTVTDRDRGRRRGEGRRPYLHLPLQHLFSRNNEGEREERLMTNPPHSVQCPSVFRGFISFASHRPLDRNEYNNKAKATFHLFLNFLASHLHWDHATLLRKPCGPLAASSRFSSASLLAGMQFLSCEDFSRFAVMGFARPFAPSADPSERASRSLTTSHSSSMEKWWATDRPTDRRPEEPSDIGW